MLSLRLLTPVIHAAPACCGQPMVPGTGIGASGGWICVVNPTHVRG